MGIKAGKMSDVQGHTTSSKAFGWDGQKAAKSYDGS